MDCSRNSKLVNLDDDSDDNASTPTVTPSQDSSKKKSTDTPVSKIDSKRFKTSGVWTDFEVFLEKNGSQRAKCIHCKTKSYAVGSNSHGTSNLRKHLEKCPAKHHKDVNGMHKDHEMNLLKKKIDQNIYREKMAIAIMKHNYPFFMVEHEGTRDVHKYLNEDVKSYTRNTAKADCLKLYKKEMENLKRVLSGVSSRICLTADLWTSCTTEGYLCLTGHYVDESWVLHSMILSFAYFAPPHKGDLIAEKIMSVLKEWGIDRKIFSLTLDNASNNDNMQENVRSQLSVQNGLLRDGQFFHVRCCAHILNLIVQDGLKVGQESIQKIRESVKYVKGSDARKQSFIKSAGIVGEKITMGLRLDVPTRWNSTYLMLESALRYCKVFNHLRYFDSAYGYCPTPSEWIIGERMCKFLKPFFEITTLFSGSDYPTSNLYFQNVWKIQIRLLEEMESQDGVISAMARRMKPKFDKYWDSYSVILAMGTVLDPRFKIAFIEYCYRKIDDFTCKEKVGVVKREMQSLFDEYVSRYSKATPQASSNDHIPSSRDEDIDEFDFYESELNVTKKSELELYLEEPKLDRKSHDKLDILKYWKNNQGRYPILSLMARDIMAIPITTVASESSFSIGNRILTKYRSSLKPETAEAVVCTRNWLFGYHSKDLYEDEMDDEDLVIDFSKFVSVESLAQSIGST